MYVQPLWRYRQWLAVLLIIANVLTYKSLISNGITIFDIAYGVILLLRLFNFARIVKARIKPNHLLRSGLRTSLWSGFLQLPFVTAIWLAAAPPSEAVLALVIAIVSVIVAIALFAITERNLHATHFTETSVYYSDRDLPSLTVAIPARNETLDLEACLHSIVANDYPKLEIIVLDDSSQDKTPRIIKQFAHDGVRFVQGTEPDEHWLAKNFAYQRLLEEASGEVVLFCGVDVRFEPESLRRIVTAMLAREKTMVSIIPRRFRDSVAGSFIQPMRYWWELALPRRQFDRPPVLSTCWVIKRDVLQKLGGFASVGHSIIPETYFARELIASDDYSFLRSDVYMGVETQKSPEEQRNTAIRVSYPELHKRPELAFVMAMTEILLLFMPFYLIFYGLYTGELLTTYIATVTALFLIATHVSIVAATSPPSIAIALINFPLAVLVEMYLGLLSMYKYEFSNVIWKGRSLTPSPLIRQEVIPHLPEF